MPTKTKTPTPPPAPRASARKPESTAVRKARSDVNAAANDFETARQTMAESGHHAYNTKAADPKWNAAQAAYTNARIIYEGMGKKLVIAQQALADALAVKK